MTLTRSADVLSAVLASASRFGRGINARPAAVRPEQPLELFEFEGCPYCRLVREVLTELDLDAMIRPCPKGGTRWRPTARELGGKEQFPFLVDRDADRSLYESADIIAHLFETYGRRPVPLAWQLRGPNVASSVAASALRRRAGTRARPARAPEQPLELYSLEASPFARIVRETLSELEIPYLLHNVGRTQLAEFVPPMVRDRLSLRIEPTSRNRKAFQARAGRVMVPYLIDPNTATTLFESGAIRRYLLDTYALDHAVSSAGGISSAAA